MKNGINLLRRRAGLFVFGASLLQVVLPVIADDMYGNFENTGTSGCSYFRTYRTRGGVTTLLAGIGDPSGGGPLNWYLGSFNVGDVYHVYGLRSPSTCSLSPAFSTYTDGQLEDLGTYTATATPSTQYLPNGLQQLDSNGTPPPPPDWCINVKPSNKTPYRQKYTVSTVVGLVVTEVLASDWIAPGATWTAQYCSQTKKVLRLTRLTDSDPPIYDFSDDIPTSDGGWLQNGAGDDYDIDDVPLIATAMTNSGIVFDDSPATPASDDNLRLGFHAIYGVNQQGFNGLLMSASRQNANLNTANAKLTTLNNSLAGKATSGDITTLGTGVASVGTAVTSAKDQAHTDALVLMANGGTMIDKLGAITNLLANPKTPAVLTNIYETLEKQRTNALAGQNIGATNWQTVGGSLGSTGVTNFVGSEINRFQSAAGVATTGSGWIEVNSFTEPARSIWEFRIQTPGGERLVDVYPFQYAGVVLIASFCNRAFSWGVLVLAYLFAFKQVKEAYDSIMRTQNSPVGVADIATAGTWAVAKRIIIGALAAVAPIALAVFFANNPQMFGLISESPFLHSGILGGALWLVEKFMPLTLAWNTFLAMMIFMLVLFAARAIAQLTMKIMP